MILFQKHYFSLCYLDLEKITNIGQYAFYGCQHLTNVYLGSRITKIAKGAFKNCTNLTRIISLRKMDSDKRIELEQLTEIYKDALGMLG